MLVLQSNGIHHDVGIAQIGIAGKRQLKEVSLNLEAHV